MNTKRVAAAAALLVAFGGGVTVLLTQSDGDVATTAAPTSPTIETSSETPTPPASDVEVTPTVPTGYGEIVPADMVVAAREAGAQVYVSPYGDGSGVVVEPGTMPEGARLDAEAITSEITGMPAFTEQLGGMRKVRTAMDEAGVKALFIVPTGQLTDTSFSPDGYRVTANKVAGFADVITSSKSEALAAAQAFADANPGTGIFDKTA